MRGPVVAPIETAGGYAFTPALRFAAAAVIAAPGHTLERAVLSVPAPLPRAYRTIEDHLERIGRPVEALCAVELRMPTTLDLDGFRAFNTSYLEQLQRWNRLIDGTPPIARTNVCPRRAVAAPVLTGFSYAVERSSRAPAFVVSGVADLPIDGEYPDDIVRRGDDSRDALREKLAVVTDVVAERVRELGTEWSPDCSVHLYTVHDLSFAFQHDVLDKLGLAPTHGVTWHDAAPPTLELELEVDVRSYDREVVCLPQARGSDAWA